MFDLNISCSVHVLDIDVSFNGASCLIIMFVMCGIIILFRLS